MGMMSEFKEFAMRGNVLDMAVGIVIGTAFGKIVSSFVSDVLMPPLGLLLGKVDFSDLAITLQEATEESALVVLSYGQFVQTLVDFVIIAFAIFLVVKVMNSLKREEVGESTEAPPPPTKEEVLLTEIRDALRARS